MNEIQYLLWQSNIAGHKRTDKNLSNYWLRTWIQAGPVACRQSSATHFPNNVGRVVYLVHGNTDDTARKCLNAGSRGFCYGVLLFLKSQTEGIVRTELWISVHSL